MEYSNSCGVILKFVVVGGGLAGLATAYSLKKAGHDVLILEKSDGTQRSSGSVPSSPNMTKVLKSWGLESTLDTIAQACTRVNFLHAESGEFLGALTAAVLDIVKKDSVAGFVFLQHCQLHDILLELCLQEGVEIHYNVSVSALEPEEGCIMLEDGGKICADLVVAADGFHSILRSYVTEEDPEEELESEAKIVLFRTTIPIARMHQHQSLQGLGTLEDWDWWMGDGYVVRCSVTNDGQDYTVVLVHPYHGPVDSNTMEWRQAPNTKSYGVDITKLDGRLRKLFRLSNNLTARVYTSPRAAESLVCPCSRVILVGEAAHPVIPGGYHATAMGFEDAETLGSLFARIQDRDQIARITTAYDEIRLPRATYVHEYEIGYQGVLKAAQGPVQQIRDQRMRQLGAFNTGAEIDEDMILEGWGGELMLITHDASEKVEDWWGQYGASIMKPASTYSLPDVQSMRISIAENTTSASPSVSCFAIPV
ncbi:hypothetical protein CPB83DRAFT_907301 [Crepidotus variabilis]|uniref:FAD-binding domain-containing protein n=1 Tax=Crepidotus variabilis TaxID=179855 RepID=A0A9P6EF72_9AGAR|nr:hypothetical protein CPB83DRAFT_907301 [Crepidotus variabilis]